MSAQVAALRALLEQRFPDASPVARRSAQAVATGLAELDRALPGGGFPLGKYSACEPRGGMTAMLRAACRTVVATGERAAWIDGGGTMAGASWDEVFCGPNGQQTLLVRPNGPTRAFGAADALLRSGGFRLVVLSGAEPRDASLTRLIRAAHDGGGAFVAITSLAGMAALRASARIAPDQCRWHRDPFGGPAELWEVRTRVTVRALGWNARAELSIPVQSHELRLSLEPRLADRRGLLPSGARARPEQQRARTS